MVKKHLQSIRFQTIFSYLLIIIIAILLSVDVSYAGVESAKFQNAWAEFMKEYRVIIASIAGVGALTSILVFIYHFMHLGAVASNPMQRAYVVRSMLISAICTALLGSITLVLTLLYSIVFGP